MLPYKYAVATLICKFSLINNKIAYKLFHDFSCNNGETPSTPDPTADPTPGSGAAHIALSVVGSAVSALMLLL